MTSNPSHHSTPALQIGWGHADITPDEPVQLTGQFHVRISEGVADPIGVTALALSSESADPASSVIFVSCEIVSIPDSLTQQVREGLGKALPDIDPKSVILNATHTHSAPEIRLDGDRKFRGGGMSSSGLAIDLPSMDPKDYSAFAAAQIVRAVQQAWKARAPGSIGFGLGTAVVGRNRRMSYLDGSTKMYGNTSDKDFSHVEGYEDHSLNLIGTWSEEGDLTGLVVNLACPSQVSENIFQVSADFWHDTRLEVRRRHGDGIFILSQCSAAGDLSPRPPWDKPAEARMLELTGRSPRQEIAMRIADGIDAVLPFIEANRCSHPALIRRNGVVELPLNQPSQADVDEAMAEAKGHLQTYRELAADLEAHPEKKQEPRWYVKITEAYRRMMWYESVKTRRESIQQNHTTMAIEANIVRIGDLVFATNPFEYYLDFGIRIKARSPAIQTFLVQLAGHGTYVPTERAAAGRSYGAVPASTPIGPEGGRQLAEWTLQEINGMWATLPEETQS